MMSVNVVNFTKICRTCLSEKLNMRPIFDAMVAEMLMTCASVQISECDGLPGLICIQCLQQVNRSYTFKQLCEKSDGFLRRFVSEYEQLPQVVTNDLDVILDTSLDEIGIRRNGSECEITSTQTGLDEVDRESDEYRNKTEQLKLEISEHLKLDVNVGFKEIEPIEVDPKSEKGGTNEIPDDKFECNECDEKFTKKWKMSIHTIKFHETNVNKCTICGKQFSQRVQLLRHVNSHAVRYQSQENGNCRVKQYECSTCQKTYLHQSSLKKHIRVQHYGEKREYRKNNVCIVCDKTFCNISWLEIHMRKHTGERPLTCETCGKTFYMPSSLSKHLLTHSEKKHNCDVCKKSFRQPYQLTVHKRMHSGEKPYVCDECGKRTTTRETLIVHMRVHSGEKPFACNHCEAAFSSKSQLTIHLRRHRGEKPYKCDRCGRAFLQKGDLDTHIRYHTGERPYSCRYCNKRFVAHSALRVHTMSHTGIKPHECSVCHKRFVSTVILRTHMRSHTGEKPYGCEICGRKYSQRGNLTAHIKTVHNVVNDLVDL